MMKPFVRGGLLLAVFVFAVPATADCLAEDSVRRLDAEYENSLVTGDYAALERLLHPDFVWVHNHAGFIQRSREELAGPIRATMQSGSPAMVSLSRKQNDVSVVRAGGTSVIYGFTDVTRTDSYVQKTGNPKHVRYHFMRTYIEQMGECALLSNHTQEVWREGQPDPA